MIRCNSCGALNDDNNKNCGSCGSLLNNASKTYNNPFESTQQTYNNPFENTSHSNPIDSNHKKPTGNSNTPRSNERVDRTYPPPSLQINKTKTSSSSSFSFSGLLSLILALLSLVTCGFPSIIALAVSIKSYSDDKKKGKDTSLSIWGITLSIIGLFALLFFYTVVYKQ